MAGRGPAPKANRQRKTDEKKRTRGTWKATKATGWQHGKLPAPPTGLKPETRSAWKTWFTSWFAAHWSPEDLPGLRVVILLYDQVQRGEYVRAAELRLQMDTYGITPKGQQDRRWRRPPNVDPEAFEGDDDEPAPEKPKPTSEGPYGHLKSVG
jgi:hypothetical protein